MEVSSKWLALVIGNSHLHWAYFEQNILIKTWQTNHDSITNFPANIPLYLASVVPERNQTFSRLSLFKITSIDRYSSKKSLSHFGNQSRFSGFR